jgi:hypothetical protein
MHPPTNKWRQRQTNHRYHAEIATDITTWIAERKDTPQDNTKN